MYEPMRAAIMHLSRLADEPSNCVAATASDGADRPGDESTPPLAMARASSCAAAAAARWLRRELLI